MGALFQDRLGDWPSVVTYDSDSDSDSDSRLLPCGGGVEYLHRSPASRRRRRKGKSRIWDSKIWSRVPRDSDLTMTALARHAVLSTRPVTWISQFQKWKPWKWGEKIVTFKLVITFKHLHTLLCNTGNVDLANKINFLLLLLLLLLQLQI
jgi:hypothetical protein